MGSEGLIAVLVIGVIIALVIGAANAGKRRTLLQGVAQTLGGTATSSTAAGTRFGVAVNVDFTSRGTGSNRTSWTYLDARLPEHYPFALYLRRHGWLDSGKIERGTMVDIVIGDQPFDEAFLVEGAPAEIVRRLLTPDLRAVLLAQPGFDLTTQDGNVRLAVSGWFDDPAKLMSALDVVARLAAGLRQATADADEAAAASAAPVAVGGDPFRAIPDDSAMQAARVARVAEVEKVKGLRANRAQAGIVGFLILVIMIIMMAR